MTTSEDKRQNIQTAPYPDLLQELVDTVSYKPRWDFFLEDAERDRDDDGVIVGRGLTLIIRVYGPDSYHPDLTRGVLHYFPVPPATYDQRAWRRWLFDCVTKVELHEAMEFFQINGERPYAPSHGPGNDPYMVREVGTVQDQKMSYLGDLNP